MMSSAWWNQQLAEQLADFKHDKSPEGWSPEVYVESLFFDAQRGAFCVIDNQVTINWRNVSLSMVFREALRCSPGETWEENDLNGLLPVDAFASVVKTSYEIHAFNSGLNAFDIVYDCNTNTTISGVDYLAFSYNVIQQSYALYSKRVHTLPDWDDQLCTLFGSRASLARYHVWLRSCAIVPIL
jgi:hypothetical protein